MKSIHSLYLMLMFLCLPFVMGAVNTQENLLDSPRSGDILQGKVNISGTTEIDGFQYAEVLFSYADNASNTWFLIDQNAQSSNHSTITTWDTTTITDGNYRLRLVIILENGTTKEEIVGGLQVRNYSSIEATEVLPTALSEGMVGTPVPGEEKQQDDAAVSEQEGEKTTEEQEVSGLVRTLVFILIGIIVVSILFVIRALVKRV